MKLFKFLFPLALALCVILGGASPIFAQTPKIYFIFVWGTLANDSTRAATETSARKMAAAFEEDNSPYADEAINKGYINTAGSLAALKPYIAETVILKGNDAHPKNILSECKRISSLAGSNDAVVVYVLCHGAVVPGSDGKWRHALSPVALNANELKMGEIGIKQSSIMKAICSDSHRLNLVITDSCSVKYVEKKTKAVTGDHGGTTPYLLDFLLKARGKLNINSSKPSTPTFPGEFARAIMDSRWNTVPSETNDRATYEAYGGTVFLNAFLRVAGSSAYDEENDLTTDRFFEKLREELDDQYYRTIKYLYLNGQDEASEFLKQDTQTLIRFDDDSLPFSEDMKFESSHLNENFSGGSNNGVY